MPSQGDWSVPGDSLTIPPFAGSGTARVFIGGPSDADFPADLTAFYAAFAETVVGGMIFFAPNGDYEYFVQTTSATGTRLHVGDRASSGIVDVYTVIPHPSTGVGFIQFGRYSNQQINVELAGTSVLEIGTNCTLEMFGTAVFAAGSTTFLEGPVHVIGTSGGGSGSLVIGGGASVTIGTGDVPAELTPVVRTSNVGGAGFTAETVVDTITNNIENGYDYWIEVDQSYQSTVNDTRAVVRIREDSITGTILQEVNCMLSQTGASGAAGYPIRLIAPYTAAATASKTFVVTALRGSGTGNIVALGRAVAPSVVRMYRRGH